MKTTILQCLQQFSSKNSKIVYHDQFLKKLKLQCQCKIVQNVRFSLLITKGAKLLNADWSMKRVFFFNFAWEEGKITRSRLVERQKFSLLIGWTYVFHIQLVSSVWAKQLRLHRSLSFNSRCICRKGIKIENWL